MEYLYESVQRSYEDYASGRVLYNAHGTTSFPVRLASEIAQRCFHILEQKGAGGPYSLYDPCCGGAYLLTVLGLMHGQRFSSVIGSDVNPEVLAIANKNLSLLTHQGLDHRIGQLQELFERYHKPSHQEALQSAARLKVLLDRSRLEDASCYPADITDSQSQAALNRPAGIHMVITDLPYGDIVSWHGGSGEPVREFFEQIHPMLDPGHSVVAVIADKGQKLRHDRFKRLQQFKAGKRQVAILEPV
ncbi:hypothetical protein JCM10914A_10430 [Paenibacillus sp. JCM 10914]